MSVRIARDRQHRQIVGVGLVVSLAIHAVVFGAMKFHVPDQSGEVGKFGQPDVEAPFETAFLELIEIEEVPEPVEVDPIIDNARAVVATPTPEQQPTPAAGELSQAAPASATEGRVRSRRTRGEFGCDGTRQAGPGSPHRPLHEAPVRRSALGCGRQSAD